MGYYTAMKMSKVQVRTITWMSLKDIKVKKDNIQESIPSMVWLLNCSKFRQNYNI